MKLVINAGYGGYSLSPLAVKKLAERKGKPCFFFSFDLRGNDYTPIGIHEAESTMFWSAYTVPNPEDYNLNERGPDGLFKDANERAEKIKLDSRPSPRHDLDLVAVVEELGKEANGMCAKLKVVEIPDGMDYVIDEYDGYESVHEQHRSWS